VAYNTKISNCGYDIVTGVMSGMITLMSISEI